MFVPLPHCCNCINMRMKVLSLFSISSDRNPHGTTDHEYQKENDQLTTFATEMLSIQYLYLHSLFHHSPRMHIHAQGNLLIWNFNHLQLTSLRLRSTRTSPCVVGCPLRRGNALGRVNNQRKRDLFQYYDIEEIRCFLVCSSPSVILIFKMHQTHCWTDSYNFGTGC